MKLQCIKCGMLFSSVIIDAKEAVGETSTNFIKHLAEKHPRELARLQGELSALMQLQAWYLAMDLAKVIDGEKQFDKVYDAQENKIIELLGLDEEEEEKQEKVKEKSKPASKISVIRP